MLENPNNYGVMKDLVSGAGSLLATAGALWLGWGKRAKWEPSEEDIARGPRRVGSLLAVIAIAILWTQTRRPEYLPTLNKLAIGLGVLAVLALCVYGFLVSKYTYEKKVPNARGTADTVKLIGGFTLTQPAKHVLAEKAGAGVYLTEQELLAGGAYDPDKVWTRGSRALAKQLFVICYLALTVAGTIALACASIILGLG